MEDTLRVYNDINDNNAIKVLILVLMEDTLRVRIRNLQDYSYV